MSGNPERLSDILWLLISAIANGIISYMLRKKFSMRELSFVSWLFTGFLVIMFLAHVVVWVHQ